ncbi:MAG: phytanoyl-CoA dioxygenase family protein [Actinomycetota bacterium]
MLSSEQLATFERDGFVAIPDAIPASDRDRLRTRALEIVDAWEPGDERSVFTTNEQERVSNREFLDSGSITWCFFEEGAIGPDGELTKPKELSINKIGHAQHDLDDEFERFAYQPLIAEVADDIGMDDPRALQSMYIFKQPHIGGEVGCHQDAAFLYTNPISVTGFWFAIEDATIENGCLWAAPGGHRGPLRQLFKRTGTEANDYLDADGTEFDTLDSTPLPEPPPAGDALVPLEVPAGTMVVLNGLLPHWSDVNRSAHSRHAYTLHCISGAAEYPSWNWLRRPAEMPLRPLGSLARP